jgi:hypothetical protein
MSSGSLRNELARLRNTEATLRKEAARHEADLAKARAAAAQKRKSAANSSSPSTAQMHLRSAQSEDKKAAVAADKLASVSDKLARNGADQTNKQRSLTAAEKSEREAIERAEKRQRDKQKSDQAAADRTAEQRRRKEKDHARELARLSQSTVRHVYVREPEPEKLRVLYLTASPEPDSPLRTDAEVNNVLKALRGAKHRDLIELHLRPAATPQDLMDGINDVRPHVIHFSGHGGGQGLLFDNASLDQPEGREISFDLLARFLGATDTPPSLLVLNACDTLDGSDLLLEVAPIVIAMADSVGDMAAGVFATQFYAGIASAQSVGAALRQAKAIMESALLDHADLPQHVARADVDIDKLVLVRLAPAST